jgi:hypothetical protein
VVFDFKQSSYKKLGKLLDKFEKDKVLTQKVIRKQDNISAINRSHPLLRDSAGGAAEVRPPTCRSKEPSKCCCPGQLRRGAHALQQDTAAAGHCWVSCSCFCSCDWCWK